MTVNQMRDVLIVAYPNYRFHDKVQYLDYQIRAIYRDKKPKMPRFEWVPVDMVMRDGYPTMVVEYLEVG